MKKMRLLLAMVWGCVALSFGEAISYRDPTDFSGWERIRTTLRHPCGIYRQEDIDHVRQKIEVDSEAQAVARSVMRRADGILTEITPEYLEEWIPTQKGFGIYGPCPACRDKGLRWHPNGTWSWTKKEPNQVVCKTCKTVFPNEKYPETIHIRSKWDPNQVFSYCGGEEFKMYGVLCRPSFSGMIRVHKLQSTISFLDGLAHAYIYSGVAKYADGVRRMLLRYAEVLPHYMFGSSIYNEIADCDPHIAGKDPFHLPTDEITPPPNNPDRKIHVGYWQGNRFGSSGQDGHYAVVMARAYDVACTAKWPDGKPVFTEEERYRIEKDALLELAYHLMCDQTINNKSVGGRAACAAVGSVVGHPDLTRFGLDGFYKTIYGWFLPDFTTSESGGYLSMTMGNILAFALWFRDYSDPDGYEPPKGEKPLKHFNVFRDTDYGICWQNAIDILQGDLRYPPIADSSPNGGFFSTTQCDMLPICYPTPRNLAFFAVCNDKKIKNQANNMMFGHPIDYEGVPEFGFRDKVYPYLQQGFLRYGVNGRDGLALINASDYGIHHHLDSLGLYLWHKKEVLSDLGYLWDHPDKPYTSRTAAHNLVVIDNQSQKSRERGGSFDLFETAGPVKVMRASSNAYKNASTYERTLLQVDHGHHGFYWLDLFRVQGGTIRDYLFHGVNNDFTVEGAELPDRKAQQEALERECRFCLKLAVNQLGTWEFSDVELYKVDAKGNDISENMASLFPEKGPTKSNVYDGWGLYKGNGTASWEPCEGKNSRGVRYSALTTAKGVDIINHSIVIGKCDGFIGPAAFLGKPGDRYRFRFYARGDKGTMKPHLLQFRPGEENSQDGRTHDSVVINTIKLGPEWTLYEGKFTLQKVERMTLLKSAPAVLRPGEKGAWKVVWKISDKQRFAAFSPYAKGEELLYADEWGQRHYNNSDRGQTLPYFQRRRKGKQLDSFVSVFHSYFDEAPLVQDVTVKETPEGCIATVKTALGEDVFLFAMDGKLLKAGDVSTDAEIAVCLSNGAGKRSASMFLGTKLNSGECKLRSQQKSQVGQVVKAVNRKDEAYFVLEGDIPQKNDWRGHTLIATGDDGFKRPYQLLKCTVVDGEFRAYTRIDGEGLPVHETKTWVMPNSLVVEY